MIFDGAVPIQCGKQRHTSEDTGHNVPPTAHLVDDEGALLKKRMQGGQNDEREEGEALRFCWWRDGDEGRLGGWWMGNVPSAFQQAATGGEKWSSPVWWGGVALSTHQAAQGTSNLRARCQKGARRQPSMLARYVPTCCPRRSCGGLPSFQVEDGTWPTEKSLSPRHLLTKVPRYPEKCSRRSWQLLCFPELGGWWGEL